MSASEPEVVRWGFFSPKQAEALSAYEASRIDRHDAGTRPIPRRALGLPVYGTPDGATAIVVTSITATPAETLWSDATWFGPVGRYLGNLPFRWYRECPLAVPVENLQSLLTGTLSLDEAGQAEMRAADLAVADPRGVSREPQPQPESVAPSMGP